MDSKERAKLVTMLRDIALGDLTDDHSLAAHPCAHAADEIERLAGTPTQAQVDQSYADDHLRSFHAIGDISDSANWRRQNLKNNAGHDQRMQWLIVMDFVRLIALGIGVVVLTELVAAVRVLAG